MFSRQLIQISTSIRIRLERGTMGRDEIGDTVQAVTQGIPIVMPTMGVTDGGR